MTDTVDCVVVGAGVVGLAVARALALQGREVMVLEATDAIGTGISSRNSEVIHAGLYYPTGSLKAQLCVRGKELLYAYCAERGVPHRRCGKLLVATSAAQLASVESIQARARANGVLDLQWLSRDEALAMEPALECVGALYSPVPWSVVQTSSFMSSTLRLTGRLHSSNCRRFHARARWRSATVLSSGSRRSATRRCASISAH